LPRLEACDDLAALARDDHGPSDPDEAAASAELDALLVRAETLAKRGSFIDLAPLQAEIRERLAEISDNQGGQAAGNVASAYSPFGGD
jgi:hypothetical protein